MFEKNLAALIRGIRAQNNKNEAKYVAQCLDEIRVELKRNDIDLKANAVTKLFYLQMLGYDISWASFHIVEVMSSSKFSYKKVGYLAASQTFRPDTDVLMLTTNLIKKDMASPNQYEVGVALNGLANFVTVDLARDLGSDVLSLLSSSKPYIRKKALLMLYKIFLCFPDALRPSFPKIREKLEDTDAPVVSAAVNVVCELARKNPKNYLALAPTLFKLLTTSTNNWMLIKIIKLFASLTPLEPRLAKKLADPLSNIISTTSAVSLLYECINTVVSSMSSNTTLVKLCVSKIRVFLEDADQNLKFLGLVALGKVVVDHPKMVSEHRDIILKCVDDKDITIRRRALDLLGGMVSKKSIVEIVQKIINQLQETQGDLSHDTSFRNELVGRILSIFSQGGYAFVTNFEWHLDVLLGLARLENVNQGRNIANQLQDVAVRVSVIRPYAVGKLSELLVDSDLVDSAAWNPNHAEILQTAAWIIGEYAELIENPQALLSQIFVPSVQRLAAQAQIIYLQAALKIFAAALKKLVEPLTAPDNANEAAVAAVLPTVRSMASSLIERLSEQRKSTDLEVQERACTTVEILKIVSDEHVKDPFIFLEVVELFNGELNPVAPKAQKKVPVPEGLDLDAWINEPPAPEPTESELASSDGGNQDGFDFIASPTPGEPSDDEDTKRKKKEKRLEKKKHDPFHLGAYKASDSLSNKDLNKIPVKVLTPKEVGLSSVLIVDDKPAKKSKKKKAAEAEPEAKEIAVNRSAEMPEGALPSDDENEGGNSKKKANELDIDLSTPLAATEQLPQIRAYGSPEEVKRQAELENLRKAVEAKKKKKEEKKKVAQKSSQPEEDEGEEAVSKPKKANKSKVAAAEELPKATEKKSSKKKKSESESAAPAEVADEKKGKNKSKKDGEGKAKKAKTAKIRTASTAADSEAERALISPPPVADVEHLPPPQAGHLEEPSAMSMLLFPIAPKYLTLESNATFTLTYDFEPSETVTEDLTCSFVIKNNSTLPLTSIEFHFPASHVARVRGHDYSASEVAAVSLPNALEPGQSAGITVALTFAKLANVDPLVATFCYSQQESAEHELVSKQVPLSILIPTSRHMKPVAISREQFADLLRKETHQFTAAASARLPHLDGLDFPRAVQILTSGLRLSLVEVTPSGTAVSLYGKASGSLASVAHVAVLAKMRADGGLNVDLKTGDSDLASGLIEELDALFHS